MADRIKIITLMEQNRRQVDAANILHVNQSIVSRLWRKFQETQSIADRPREGRPRKTTPGQDRYVRLSARRNPIASATTLRHDLREATGVKQEKHLHGSSELYAKKSEDSTTDDYISPCTEFNIAESSKALKRHEEVKTKSEEIMKRTYVSPTGSTYMLDMFLKSSVAHIVHWSPCNVQFLFPYLEGANRLGGERDRAVQYL
ncbi:hypothetical protein ANN_25291 [Periplaneta americana]|uniref:Insertion element IS150 protein InsJ-like helix-turn-helix domain-containing protein n=1 Tax=Periplaneta americana TaxID=6978 RepID=A0ABQ8S0Y2_PERAM|nr:hypothetical protein ANN_25291 [Periplaneta americana]